MATNSLSLPAGTLRHGIQVQALSTTQDTFGQLVESWNTFLVTRASIALATQREIYQANQFTSQVTHIVTLRWPGNTISIKPGMRVVFGTHTYIIQACDNVLQRNRVLRLLCLELNGAD